MTTARTTLAALVLAGGLVACGTTTVAAPKPVPDLATVLTADIDGFAPAAVPELPATVCRDPDHGDPVPQVPGTLGEPTAVGYSADGADLHAWAWRTATPEDASAVVDEAVADLQGCSFQIYFDSDTDGDGEIDAGGSEEQSARSWTTEHWTGLSSSGRFFGGGAELVESRFGRNGDVVVLVVLTVHSNDDTLLPTVDAYLDGVAARLS